MYTLLICLGIIISLGYIAYEFQEEIVNLTYEEDGEEEYP